MLGEQDDLSNVLGDVRQRAVHRRERGHGLAANDDRGGKVIRAKLAERAGKREPAWTSARSASSRCRRNVSRVSARTAAPNASVVDMAGSSG
jgi:hypothetical protein